VKATDKRMDLFDAGCRLGLFDGIDHATMTARGQKDEPLALEVEAGRDLVSELIGDEGLGALVFWKPLGTTSAACMRSWAGRLTP